MNRKTAVRRATLSGLAAAGLVALATVPASAHVTITPSTTAAGATAELRVEIPHGCAESATTAITIRMPEGVTEVRASGTDRWAVDQAADALTYSTDTPLPDGEHAEVAFSVRLPDDDGATLVFPVVQRCEVGEAAWTEVAEHAEGHDDLERPAPVLVVTEGKGGDEAEAEPLAEASAVAEHAEAGADDAAEAAPADAAPAAADSGRNPLVTYGAAALLVAGALAGGVVLLRRRRNS
ncbi:YcnI family copper-binding membrane protein [Promicromonospora sukumoe]|uniref:YcnI family copper-binding membrane protein n=1 Tax=Promicromonospora sukumoe TaxID=88382 RepID=UPI00036275A5|nr:YcnI family protein [Promicromonospora sukumoe]